MHKQKMGSEGGPQPPSSGLSHAAPGPRPLLPPLGNADPGLHLLYQFRLPALDLDFVICICAHG